MPGDKWVVVKGYDEMVCAAIARESANAGL